MKYLIALLIILLIPNLFATFKDLDNSWYTGDKQMHGFVSFGITVTAFDIVNKTPKIEWNPYISAIGITLALGVGKEIVDHNMRGMPLNSCLQDMTWDLTFIGVGTLVNYLMDRYQVKGTRNYEDYRYQGANVLDLRDKKD